MALPTMAQQQEWKSTSAMQTSGSVYTPQVNAVGATGVSEMATTTTSSTQNKGPRRMKMDEDEFGGETIGGVQNPDESGTPLGDAVLPLLLMSLAFCGVVYLRRKKVA